ncbi:MAG: hypothetical protein LBS70_04025 [Candidatus Accumulibacter sp.]|jgi:hypothetical protein|nr:hypothetical protein [Accumulibacter sp.]
MQNYEKSRIPAENRNHGYSHQQIPCPSTPAREKCGVTKKRCSFNALQRFAGRPAPGEMRKPGSRAPDCAEFRTIAGRGRRAFRRFKKSREPPFKGSG